METRYFERAYCGWVSSQKRLLAEGGSLVCQSWVIRTKVGSALPCSSDGSRVVQGYERQEDGIHLPFLG